MCAVIETDFPAPPAERPGPKRRFSPLLLVMILVALLGVGGTGFGLFRLFSYHMVTTADDTAMGTTIPREARLVYRSAGDQGINRGDLVVFDLSALPDSGGERGLMLKRVIAVAGDVVSCCENDEHHSITVNGKPVKESYVARKPDSGLEEFIPFKAVTVPPGAIFVAGDDRTNSRDSRIYADEPGNGAIELSKVYGIVVGIGHVLAAEPVPRTTAFVDAGLPGEPLNDTGFVDYRNLALAGAGLFLVGFIGSIVIVARSAGKRRRAAAVPPAH